MKRTIYAACLTTVLSSVGLALTATPAEASDCTELFEYVVDAGSLGGVNVFEQSNYDFPEGVFISNGLSVRGPGPLGGGGDGWRGLTQIWTSSGWTKLASISTSGDVDYVRLSGLNFVRCT